MVPIQDIDDTNYFRQIRVYELYKLIADDYCHKIDYQNIKHELIKIIEHLGSGNPDLNLKEPIISFKLTDKDKAINMTPLQVSCAIGDVDLIQTLIKSVNKEALGINYQDRHGNTALYWLEKFSPPNKELTEARAMLLELGAR